MRVGSYCLCEFGCRGMKCRLDTMLLDHTPLCLSPQGPSMPDHRFVWAEARLAAFAPALVLACKDRKQAPCYLSYQASHMWKQRCHASSGYWNDVILVHADCAGSAGRSLERGARQRQTFPQWRRMVASQNRLHLVLLGGQVRSADTPLCLIWAGHMPRRIVCQGTRAMCPWGSRYARGS
jgi:hypothetical protein